MAKLGVAFAGAAAVSLLAVLATAEPSATAAPAASTCDLDVVKRVVEEGRARGDVDDWTGALAKFRDAATCAESPGLRFNIASSEEHLGKLVAAVTDFRLAQREAKRDGAAEVVDVVAARLAALEPRIATLTFRRPAGSERAVVFVDGLPLADVASGRVEVDPGEHRVTALLDGVMRFHRTVRVVDGRTERVVLALEPLPPPPVAPRPPVAGYVVGGAGLVSLAVMGLFIGLRQGIIADLDVACHGTSCTPDLAGKIEQGKVYTGIAEGTAVAGALGVGLGFVLVLRRPAERGSSAAAFVRARSTGVELGSTF